MKPVVQEYDYIVFTRKISYRLCTLESSMIIIFSLQLIKNHTAIYSLRQIFFVSILEYPKISNLNQKFLMKWAHVLRKKGGSSIGGISGGFGRKMGSTCRKCICAEIRSHSTQFAIRAAFCRCYCTHVPHFLFNAKIFAQERSSCCCSLAFATNYANGLGPSSVLTQKLLLSATTYCCLFGMFFKTIF